MTILNTKTSRNTRMRSHERGAVMALFVSAIFFLLTCLALAVDLGAAYFASSTLTKAADAGALAAARYGLGDGVDAKNLAEKVAAANFPLQNIEAEYEAVVSYPGTDTIRVSVSAKSDVPTFFSQLLKRESIPISTVSEATRYPLDMSFVLDVSGSLESAGVFDDMQDAAKTFVSFFNESLDQVGLVAYSQAAEEHYPIQKNFQSSMKSKIDDLESIYYTNIEEGLRVGKLQLDDAADRANAIKILVLFTDGRTNAFADEFYMNLSSPKPQYYTGVITTTNSGAYVTGFYEQDGGRRIKYFSSSSGDAVTCSPECYDTSNDLPDELPGNLSVTGSNVLDIALSQAEGQASAIRGAGYTIYTVALGNQSASDVYDTPDLAFLKRLANEDGIANGSQPEGAMLFAPTASELEDVFSQLADRILTRLTK